MKIENLIPYEKRSDCLIIKEYFEEQQISIVEAYVLWEKYSDTVCASWLVVNEDSLFDCYLFLLGLED